MKKVVLLAWIWIWLATVLAVAQSKEELAAYQKGKTLMESGKWNEAYNVYFNLMTTVKDHNPLKPNALYYAAYCQYQKKQYRDANYISFQLLQNHPEWKHIDKVYLLKAMSQFGQHLWAEGILALKKLPQDIKSSAIQSILDSLSTDTLHLLIEKFPDQKELHSEKDRRYQSRVKKQMDIAVLLPFNMLYKYPFVGELWQGMLLAKDSLSALGIEVNLHPYSVGKDSADIKSLLLQDQLRLADAVVGPIFSHQIASVAEYCARVGLPMTSPLTSNLHTYAGYYLLQSSLATQAETAAKFAYETFTRTATGVILYGSGQSDSLLATQYKLHFENNGGKIFFCRKLSQSNAQYMNILFDKLSLDSLGHVFAVGNDPLLATYLYAYLEGKLLEKTAKYKEIKSETEDLKPKEEIENNLATKLSAKDVPVLTTKDWLTFSSISYSQFMLHNTHFIDPGYLAMERNPNLTQRYFEENGLPPSQYFAKGFESIYFFAQKWGNWLRKSDELLSPSAYFLRMDYTNGRKDNAYVPIYSLENYNLVIKNQPKQ